MIAHVAPANCTSESALNTLRYAERLKAVAAASTASTGSTASICVASPANGTASAASAASAASPAGAPPAVRTGMPSALAGAESGLPPPPASPARRPPRTPLPLPPASPARRATEGPDSLRSAVPSSPKVFKPAPGASAVPSSPKVFKPAPGASAVPSSPKVFKPAPGASPAGRTAGAVAALHAYMDASSAGSGSAVDASSAEGEPCRDGRCERSQFRQLDASSAEGEPCRDGRCERSQFRQLDASSADSAAPSAVDVCRDLLRVAYDADGWKQELRYLDALATRPGGVEVERYFDRLETVLSERLLLLHALQARVPQLRAHYCDDALDAARVTALRS